MTVGREDSGGEEGGGHYYSGWYFSGRSAESGAEMYIFLPQGPNRVSLSLW